MTSTEDERRAVLAILSPRVDLDLAQVATRSRLAPSRALSTLVRLRRDGAVRTVLLPGETVYRWALRHPSATPGTGHD